MTRLPTSHDPQRTAVPLLEQSEDSITLPTETLVQESKAQDEVSKVQEENDRLPWKPVLAVLLSCAGEAMGEAITIPFLYYLVSDFTSDDTSSAERGSKTGMLISTFYVPLFLMNIVMGAVSDRIGRKPVLIIGCIGNAIGNLLFGQATSLTFAFLFRFLTGTFSFNSTIVKSLLGDLSNSKTRPRAFALYGMVYGLSFMIGPFIGGYLVRPTEKFESLADNTFLKQRPYFISSFLAPLLDLIAIILSTLWIPSSKSKKAPVNAPNTTTTQSSTEQDDKQPGKPSCGSFCTYVKQLAPVMTPVFLYTLIAFYFSLFQTGVSISGPAPIAKGGLGLSTKEVGWINSLYGLFKLTYQLFVFPFVMRYISVRTSVKLGISLLISIVLVMPSFVTLPSQSIQLWIALGAQSMIASAADVFGYLSVLMMITTSVPSHHLGSAHGIASTSAAATRFIAPTLSGLLWAKGNELLEKTNLLWSSAAVLYWTTAAIAMLAMIYTFVFIKKPVAPKKDVEAAEEQVVEKDQIRE